MNSGAWTREFDVAFRAVRDATELARGLQPRVSDAALLKADQSPVTIADYAVQALVASRLAAAFPDDPLVAEEDAAALRRPGDEKLRHAVFDALRRAAPPLATAEVLDLIDRGRSMPSERFWTLDPIDGTQGFLRGDQYVVALALIVSGRVEVAMLGCPHLSLSDDAGDAAGAMACAVRGHGAHRVSLGGGDFTPLRVSKTSDPRAARVLRSVESAHINQDAFGAVLEALGVRTTPTSMDSQAKHALLAASGADVMIRIPATTSYREKTWDQAAGSLIVEEAGGTVTDVDGKPLDFESGRRLTRNYGVVASNGALHAAVVDAFRQIRSSTPDVRN